MREKDLVRENQELKDMNQQLNHMIREADRGKNELESRFMSQVQNLKEKIV